MIDEDELASVAAQLAVRVREDPPESNGRWLAAMIPDGVDPAWWYLALAVATAAAIPTACPHCHRELTWRELTAWMCRPQVRPELSTGSGAPTGYGDPALLAALVRERYGPTPVRERPRRRRST